MSPKITVITPSYNQAEFIDDCILSVIDQDYPDVEHIIIDGGSTDRSVDIIKKYEQHLAYWVSEPDEGQSDAINKGFALASGDLVAWLNADDYYFPGALKAAAEAFRNAPGGSFFFGNGYRVNRNKEILSDHFPSNEVRFNYDALLYGLNYILQPATFINKTALDKIGFLDTGLDFGMDTDLWLRLCKEGDPVPMQAFIAASREYETTKSKGFFFGRIEELRQITEKHTGYEVTPGLLCYYLDTLSRYMIDHPGLFTETFQKDVHTFWSAAAAQMAVYGARPDGSPVENRAISTITVQSNFPRGGQPTQEEDRGKHPIGIELRQITIGKSGGIAQYIKSLLSALFAANPESDYVVFCTIFNRDLFSSEYPNVEFVTLPTTTFFDRLNHEIAARRIKTLFRSYPIEDHLDLELKHQVVFIPDLQHESYPEFFPPEILQARRSAFRHVLSNAGSIITLTEYTRQTILAHPANSCSNVIVTPSALQKNFSDSPTASESDESALVLDKAYFYFPANLWPHKNHRRVLEAFQRFLDLQEKPFELILTGHPEGWEELSLDFPQLPVRHLGFVNLSDVRRLYENATALLFFTLYEGFGMPVLEAFACNTPVLCSNVTSLPEVGGDAVLSCDPTDVDAIAGLMRDIVEKQELREKLIRKGKERLAQFTWEGSAENLQQALEEAPGISKPDMGRSNKTPLVSIVTPSFNQGQFLRRTIDSVLNQTYPYIEYLVVDGGSTDDSLDILQSYGERVNWISEPDNGQAHAINKGFIRSNGEIQAYLNSDDVLKPDAVEKIVAYFETNPETDLVYGRAHYIDEDDAITGMYNTDDYSFERLMQDCCICQPAAFWRTPIAEKVGQFDESLHMALDYDYWLRIDRAGGKVHHIHDILASSRLYADTKTLSSRDIAYEEAFQVCSTHGGYVHINYFYGLWNYLIWEKASGLPRIFLRWRNSFIHIGKIHHKIYNFGLNLKYRLTRRRARQRAGALKREILHRLQKYFGFSRPVIRKLRARLYQVNARQPVFGFWTDNWLAPIFQVYVRRKNPGQALYIEGTPVTTMNICVRINRKIILTQELEGGQLTRIDIPAQNGDRIIFEFDNPVVDQGNRYLAFLLSGTNLFAEEDPIA